ncbi:hypothetical protein V8E53_005129 [Lactarius tabidus]
MCVSLLRLPQTFLILMAWQTAQASTCTDILDGTAARIPILSQMYALDLDYIVVPSGRDCWGKIAVLRDVFQAKARGKAWEYDLSSDAGIDVVDKAHDPNVRAPPNLFVSSSVENMQPTPHPLLNNTIPDQAFLAKNLDENACQADPDPRGSSALPPTHPWRRPPTSSDPWVWHAPEDRRRWCARASPEAMDVDLTAALAMSLWESETRQQVKQKECQRAILPLYTCLFTLL